MASILGSLASIATNVLSKALPVAIEVGKGAFGGLIKGLTSLDGRRPYIGDTINYGRSNFSLAGYRASLAGYRAALAAEDPRNTEGVAVVTSELAKQEQICQGKQGEDVADLITSFTENKVIEQNLLGTGLINTKADQVIITSYPKYKYVKEGSENVDDQGITIIHSEDHAYVHLIPKLFNNYNNLFNHRFIQLSGIAIKPKNMSWANIPVRVVFLPQSRDTTNITNDSLKNCVNQSDFGQVMGEYYVIRRAFPTIFNSNDGFVPDNCFLNPNFFIQTESLKLKYTATDLTTGSGRMLSYGTVCFLTENATSDTVAFEFEMSMVFNVYDEFTMPVEYISDSGSGNGSTTSSQIQGSNCLPKRKGKFGGKP